MNHTIQSPNGFSGRMTIWGSGTSQSSAAISQVNLHIMRSISETAVAFGADATFVTTRCDFNSSTFDQPRFVVLRPLPRESVGQELNSALSRIEKNNPKVTKFLRAARRQLARGSATKGRALSIRELRLSAGMSQAELAAALGTSQAYVSRLETGRERNPTLDRLRALSAAMKVSVEDVVGAFGHGE